MSRFTWELLDKLVPIIKAKEPHLMFLSLLSIATLTLVKSKPTSIDALQLKATSNLK